MKSLLFQFLFCSWLLASGISSTAGRTGALPAPPESSNAEEAIQEDTVAVRSLDELLLDLRPDRDAPTLTIFGLPRVFMGYRLVEPPEAFTRPDSILSPNLFRKLYFRELPDSIDRVVYGVTAAEGNVWDLAELPEETRRDSVIVRVPVERELLSPIITGEVVPEWLRRGAESFNRQMDAQYISMVLNPSHKDYAFWNLPVPPSMPKEEISYKSFLKNQHLSVNLNSAYVPEVEVEKRHWLHSFNAGLQFSQAYLSKNWYQGGNNYLALLGNLFWDVQLNQTWHPKMMFQSTLSYKLGLNSTDNNSLHKYSISEDLLQYNLKAGYQAAHHWYYSFTAQFKTQILNNYPVDSIARTASFLTPGALTLGLGMTYTKENAAKSIIFNASISPLSYNLRTAIDPDVDHSLFGMEQNERTINEFGSSAEITFNWRIWDNILYKTRLFLFSDYSYFLADWEHTINFEINRFLSTQIYVHMRYDTSTETLTKWKHFMLREVLSFGLAYTFSTKQ